MAASQGAEDNSTDRRVDTSDRMTAPTEQTGSAAKTFDSEVSTCGDLSQVTEYCSLSPDDIADGVMMVRSLLFRVLLASLAGCRRQPRVHINPIIPKVAS